MTAIAYEWDWHVVLDNPWVFVHGLLLTLQITTMSCLIGIAIGTFVAILRAAPNRFARTVADSYTEILLALPVLVLMIWLYYCIPLFLPAVRFASTVVAIAALSLSLSAFIAEIIRAGIAAVPSNQTDVASVLGLSPLQVMRFIVLPQAMRSMLPPIVGQVITCWKLSALASIIAVYELLHSAQNLISVTFRPLEIYTAVAIVYLATILPVSLLSKRLESKRTARIGIG